MLDRSRFSGPRQNEIDATFTLRVPDVGLGIDQELRLELLVHPTPLAPLKVSAGGPTVEAAALERQSRFGDSPAIALATDQIVGKHLSVRKKDLVERLMTVHLLEWPHLYTRLAHIDQEVAQSLVLRQIPVGACQQNAEVGMVGAGVPDLLSVEDPLAIDELGSGTRAC